MSVTLKTIADDCGLAPSTVSNILSNGGGAYSRQTIKLVLAQAQKRGYRPNPLSKSLRQNRTAAVGILMPHLNHPMYAELLYALTGALAAQDLDTMVGVPHLDQARQKVCKAYHSFLSWRLQGFVLIVDDKPDIIDAADIRRITESTVCVTLLAKPWPACSSICPDRRQMASLAVEHLMSLGHRRIGFLSMTDNPAHSKNALIADELRRRGLALAQRDIWFSPLPESSEKTTGDWFDLGRQFALRRDRPTAMIARSETVASRFISGFLMAGGRVPDDLSIVTFNHSKWSGSATFPLTAAGVPLQRMTEQTIAFLNEGFAEKKSGEPFVRNIVMQPELEVRASTGPAPAST